MLKIALIASFMLTPVVFALAEEPEHDHAIKAAPAKLDSIKRLIGDWVSVDESGQATDQIVSSYRSTAAGHAVIEFVFPGSEHEMVTVYHMDGDDLVLTHYCILGNQPRMKLASAPDGSELIFKCDGGTNFKSEADDHMHEGHLTFLGPDRMKSEWFEHKDGEPVFSAKFELVRKTGMPVAEKHAAHGH